MEKINYVDFLPTQSINTSAEVVSLDADNDRVERDSFKSVSADAVSDGVGRDVISLDAYKKASRERLC